MANVNQKQKHSYKVSYAREVGSSFDPDLEDINSWEEELAGAGEHSGEFIYPCSHAVPQAVSRPSALCLLQLREGVSHSLFPCDRIS